MCLFSVLLKKIFIPNIDGMPYILNFLFATLFACQPIKKCPTGLNVHRIRIFSILKKKNSSCLGVLRRSAPKKRPLRLTMCGGTCFSDSLSTSIRGNLLGVYRGTMVPAGNPPPPPAPFFVLLKVVSEMVGRVPYRKNRRDVILEFFLYAT